MDGGAWWAAVHGVARSWTRLSDFTFTFHFHALEKEMATHSSVLAWRIPGRGSLVGCRLWGCTESDTTEATLQQQQQALIVQCFHPVIKMDSELSTGEGTGYPLQYSCASLVAQLVKNPPTSAGDVRDTGLIPRLGRSPGVGNGNPLQYSSTILYLRFIL